MTYYTALDLIELRDRQENVTIEGADGFSILATELVDSDLWCLKYGSACNVRFVNCVFDGCFECVDFSKCTFINCKLVGRFCKCHFYGAVFNGGLCFSSLTENCVFTRATFIDCDLRLKLLEVTDLRGYVPYLYKIRSGLFAADAGISLWKRGYVTGAVAGMRPCPRNTVTLLSNMLRRLRR